MKRLLISFALVLLLMPLVSAAQPSAELIEYSNQACPTGSAKFGLSLTNPGTATDTYTITTSVPWSTIAPQQVQLAPGESRTAYLWLQPPADMKPGEYDFRVTAESANSGDRVRRTGTLEVLSCRAVDLHVAEPSQNVCRGERATYDISVRNLGDAAETYRLSASGGELSRDRVELAPDERTTITLSMTSDEAVSRDITVRADSTSSYASDEVTVSYTSDTCRGAKLFVSPSDRSICEDETAQYTATLWNTGKVRDTYSLTANADVAVNDVTLRPGESVSFDIAASRDLGEHVLHVRAASQTFSGFEVSQDVRMTVNNCYDVAVRAPAENTVAVENAAQELLRFSLENNGSATNTYTLLLDGPSWADVRPVTITVAPGESGEAYLYVAPDYFSSGEYTAVLTVQDESGTINKQGSIDLIVGKDSVTARTDERTSSPTGRIAAGLSGVGGVLTLVLIMAVLFLGGYWYFRRDDVLEGQYGGGGAAASSAPADDDDDGRSYGGGENWRPERAFQGAESSPAEQAAYGQDEFRDPRDRRD